jgi:hypothetical protein
MEFDNMTLNDLYIRREDLIQDLHDDTLAMGRAEALKMIDAIGEEIVRIEQIEYDENYEDTWTDVEADADTLASAGWGTDEDYGYFGDDMAW